jgi:outer membrane receptor protein involved in Fe transport
MKNNLLKKRVNKMSPTKHAFFLTILIIFSFASFLQAQQSGSISGEIRDAVTQQPLPMVNVVIVGTSLGNASSESGYYHIKQIPPGVYQVKASLIGYEGTVISEVYIAHQRNKSVNIQMRPTGVEVEGVSVQADYYTRPLETPVSFRSLESEEIRRSPGSGEDIFRVIQSMPGVASASGKSAQLIVRGGSPDENLTLLENIEIYNPIHFARSGASMGVISIVNPSILKQVDFMTGGFPVKYGDKMSSVFEMSLQDGNREMLNTDLNLNIAGFGIMLDGPITKNSSGILSVRRGFFDIVTNIMNKPVSPEYYDAVGKVNYDLDPRNRISLVGFYYLDKVKREGMTEYSLGDETFDHVTRDDFGSALGINWRSLISDRAILLTTLSITDNGWKTRQGFSYNPSIRTEDVTEEERLMKSELTIQLTSIIELKTGFALKSNYAEDNKTVPDDTTQTGKIIPGFSRVFNIDNAWKYSGYIQSSINPLPFLTMSAGLRYDSYEFTGEHVWSPRASAQYKFSEKTSVNASCGIFYQTPMSYMLAQDPANKQLHSSRSVHYVFGIEHRLTDETRATFEYYYKDLSNVITRSDSNRVLTNTGSGYAEGIEFAVQKKFTEGLVGSFSYSYSTSMRRDLATQSLYAFEFDRPHIINIIGGYELGNGWILGIKYNFASGSPYTPPIGIVSKLGKYYILNGEINSARYPDVHRLDLRIDKRFNLGAWTLTAYIDLWNVYAKKNIISYSFSADDNRNIIQTEKLDFGLLPLFGLSAQF